MVEADGNRRVFFPDDPDRGYHAAALARGLLEDNNIWIRTLEESARERMGCRAFRRFFAYTVMHSIPPDRQGLFDHFVGQLAPRIGNETREQQRERAYQHLEYIFRQWDSTCEANGLVGPANYNEAFVRQDLQREPRTEFVADDPDAHQTRDWWRRYADERIAAFRPSQSTAFNRILGAVDRTNSDFQLLYRVVGDAGTGGLIGDSGV